MEENGATTTTTATRTAPDVDSKRQEIGQWYSTAIAGGDRLFDKCQPSHGRHQDSSPAPADPFNNGYAENSTIRAAFIEERESVQVCARW